MATATQPATAAIVRGKLQLITPYDPKLINRIREELPFAEYIAARREWTIPATPYTAAKVLGFGACELSPEAMLLAGQWIRGQGEAGLLPKFHGRPRWRHQQEAYAFTSVKRGAMLSMDMGTGKTAVAVDECDHSGARLALICAPNSVVPQWGDQLALYCGREAKYLSLVDMPLKKRTELLDFELKRMKGSSALLAVGVNYEVLASDTLGKLLQKQAWDMLVADESHRGKSPTSGTSKALRKLADRSARVLALTGTPMPHSPLDIWAQFALLDQGVFGPRYTAFRDRYAQTHKDYPGMVLNWLNQDEFTAKMAMLAFRVKASDVLDLPERQITDVHVELPPAAARAYKQLKADAVTMLERGELAPSNALVMSLRLLQIASGCVPDDTGDLHKLHQAKSDALADILDGLGKDEPVVVFAQFRPNLAEIKRVTEAAGRRYLELSGSVNELATFQKEGKPGDVLGVQIQSGGTGIDLTRAACCVYYSCGNNQGHYDQSLARVHRPGQTRNTRYWRLVARGTIDRAIYRTFEQRGDLHEGILRHLKGVD